jgi:hypothetical protein
MKTQLSLISHNLQTTAASLLSGVAFFVGGAFYFYFYFLWGKVPGSAHVGGRVADSS